MKEVVIGDCRLILADCLDVLPTLGGIDCTVTSPPYNQIGNLPEKGSGMWGKTGGGAGFLRAWHQNGYADNIEESEYQEQQKNVFELVRSASNEKSCLFYNHQLRWRNGVLLHPVEWFKPKGWLLRSEIIWDRGGGMMMNARMFVRFDERILWFVAGDKWKWKQECVGLGTIWKITIEQQNQGKKHPVAFPMAIPARCISATTDIGDTVLDCYMGSGTTGVACLRTGRKFIGIEKEKKYFDIACRRIQAELDRSALFANVTEDATQATLWE